MGANTAVNDVVPSPLHQDANIPEDSRIQASSPPSAFFVPLSIEETPPSPSTVRITAQRSRFLWISGTALFAVVALGVLARNDSLYHSTQRTRTTTTPVSSARSRTRSYSVERHATYQQKSVSSSRRSAKRNKKFPLFMELQGTSVLKKRYNVDGPPVSLPEGITMESLRPKPPRRGAGEAAAPPKRQTTTRTPPPSRKDTSGVPLHASEALQCRESVVNFVINATDGKDECDGLIKAFDKTCNTDGENFEAWQKRKNRASKNGDRVYVPGRQRHLSNSRRLWDKLNTPYGVKWRAFLFRTGRSIERLLDYVLGKTDSTLVFAEDEVYFAWEEAQYLVAREIDSIVQKEARSAMNQQQCALRDREEEAVRQSRRILREKVVARDLEVTDVAPASNETKKVPSLQLPIKVSDKTAEDALFLQQGENVFKAANETIAARAEAAKSKQSIADTSDAVSAIFNDPSSIEARTCCASILTVYQGLCSTDDEEQVSDSRLSFLVLVMALCGMVKSLIRHFKVLWLPEAAGCIIVGVLSGYALEFFPHHAISFDGNWFLRVLVPPIIFEAALSIDKRSFNRHIVPILIYAVIGTLVATLLTAEIVHRGTTMLSGWCAPIPYVEALTFGALISSIDPIAVLSVLSNIGMNDTDTIYVLIFGESLLNDGVAIVLFHTIVHFLDESLIIDRDALIAAAVHFCVVAIGSLLVGVASGMMSTVYYWIFYGCQTPLVEVLMFFCWALLPYYVCDGIGWSGIVATVALGFVMDLHIVGHRRTTNSDDSLADVSDHSATTYNSNGDNKEKSTERSRRRIFDPHGHLSPEAKTHIGFVTEIIATGMETAIFAYLGFFLFSHRYHWNFFHALIAILGCCISRAAMIPSLGFVANWTTKIRQRRAACRTPPSTSKRSNPAGFVIDRKMQIALWFAGLRGAMSFALVEHIPLYDSFSGEGTRLKPELKAMTSASIMFTVFVLGGRTYYVMQSLGIAPNSRNNSDSLDFAPLNRGHHDGVESEEDKETFETAKATPGKATTIRRQRFAQSESLVAI